MFQVLVLCTYFAPIEIYLNFSTSRSKPVQDHIRKFKFGKSMGQNVLPFYNLQTFFSDSKHVKTHET